MLFDAHGQAFRVFGGVPRRGMYDNMRTAADRVGVGKARQVNARFFGHGQPLLAGHRVLQSGFSWKKGQVEKNVQDARHRLMTTDAAFATISDLNDRLEQQCRVSAAAQHWTRNPVNE